MDKTIYEILKLLFDFALEVWLRLTVRSYFYDIVLM